jgi:hypothetical protein
MKTLLEVSEQMVQQFEEFWKQYSDTPFKGYFA